MKWLILITIYVVIFGLILIITPENFVEIVAIIYFITLLTTINNAQFKAMKAFSSWLAEKILK